VGDRPDEHDLVAGAVGVDDREARLVARPAAAADDDLVRERRARDALDQRADVTALGDPGPDLGCSAVDASSTLAGQ
jgi:hypothetical protein